MVVGVDGIPVVLRLGGLKNTKRDGENQLARASTVHS
jgi:hypothetical protein